MLSTTLKPANNATAENYTPPKKFPAIGKKFDVAAQDLADGHFDGDSILENCKELRQEVNMLKPLAEQRKAALDLSLQFHEFNFDLQRELEWIAEKITIISGTEVSNKVNWF